MKSPSPVQTTCAVANLDNLFNVPFHAPVVFFTDPIFYSNQHWTYCAEYSSPLKIAQRCALTCGEPCLKPLYARPVGKLWAIVSPYPILSELKTKPVPSKNIVLCTAFPTRILNLPLTCGEPDRRKVWKYAGPSSNSWPFEGERFAFIAAKIWEAIALVCIELSTVPTALMLEAAVFVCWIVLTSLLYVLT